MLRWSYKTPCRQLLFTHKRLLSMASSSSDLVDDSEESVANAAMVYTKPDDSSISIQLQLEGKYHFMKRNRDEPVSQTLLRLYMKQSVLPHEHSKEKQAQLLKSFNNSVAHLTLPDSDRILDFSTPNRVAWRHGSRLKLNDKIYKVVVNPPLVVSLACSKRQQLAMVSVPFIIKADLLNADVTRSKWIWQKKGGDGEWVVVSRQHIYTPVEADFGHLLRVTCVPQDGKGMRGVSCTYELPHTVRSGWNRSFVWEAVQAKLKPLESPNSFRLVSYNLLADAYASSTSGRKVIFPYVPAKFLAATYRQQLHLKELLGYQADLLCLQEVDAATYSELLEPVLKHYGYTGSFEVKEGATEEGCAMFHTSKFTLMAQHRVVLKSAILQPKHCHLIEPFAAEGEGALKPFFNVPTIGQLCLLRLGDLGRMMCVVNTHFFFHPDAPHIRNVHAAVLLKEVSDFCESHGHEMKDISLIFCGDLNSTPETGLIEYMCNGFIDKDHSDFEEGKSFRWGRKAFGGEPTGSGLAGDDESAGEAARVRGNGPVLWKLRDREGAGDAGSGLAEIDSSFKHPFKLFSATGPPSKDMKLTNYTKDFAGTLDWIFLESGKFEVEDHVAGYEEAVLSQHLGLPSEEFPSDHTALIADIHLV